MNERDCQHKFERYSAGNKVFITTGIGVLEGTVERMQYGRVVVCYKGCDREPVGCMCISRNRLYRTYDEAAAHVGAQCPVSAQHPAEIAHTQSQPAPTRRVYLADKPGDGWARR